MTGQRFHHPYGCVLAILDKRSTAINRVTSSSTAVKCFIISSVTVQALPKELIGITDSLEDFIPGASALQQEHAMKMIVLWLAGVPIAGILLLKVFGFL